MKIIGHIGITKIKNVFIFMYFSHVLPVCVSNSLILVLCNLSTRAFLHAFNIPIYITPFQIIFICVFFYCSQQVFPHLRDTVKLMQLQQQCTKMQHPYTKGYTNINNKFKFKTINFVSKITHTHTTKHQFSHNASK